MLKYTVHVRFVGLKPQTESLGEYDTYQEALDCVQLFFRFHTMHRLGLEFVIQQMSSDTFQVLCFDNRSVARGKSKAGFYCMLKIGVREVSRTEGEIDAALRFQ